MNQYYRKQGYVAERAFVRNSKFISQIPGTGRLREAYFTTKAENQFCCS